MAWNLCKTRNKLVIAFYATLLLALGYYDEEVFNESVYFLSRATEVHRWTFEPTEELVSSYRLPKHKRNETIILVWFPMFGWANTFNYTTDQCIVTYDRSAIDVASAVVFHFVELGENSWWLPHSRRQESQRWIWWCLEPPWNTKYVFRKRLDKLNGVFNWTMTYRVDSDVHFPYGNIKEDGRVQKTVKEMIEEKTASFLGIWIVSNCEASARRRLIEEMQRYIAIDVRGKCSGKTLCRGGCALNTIKRYKFVFSFENSRCRDYITEKFITNGLLGGAVPVVMGPPRKDYEKIAPPHSFIHVEDFNTAKELAEYLKLLDNDDLKYGEYLKWKSIPESAEHTPPSGFHHTLFGWNNLCKKLKESGDSEHSVVNNLDKWWYGKDYDGSSATFSMCNPEDGPSGYSFYSHVIVGCSAAIIIFCLLTLRFCNSYSLIRHMNQLQF